MVQTLLVVVLFVAAMALLPWLVRRVQQRQGRASAAGGAALPPRVLSAVSVGPQQRVVTVEVGTGAARTCLVLGVTAQHITCLHVLSASVPVAVAGADSNAGPAGFSQAMAAARAVPAATVATGAAASAADRAGGLSQAQQHG